jgi:ABC-type sugar transport system substrate-binding protein
MFRRVVITLATVATAGLMTAGPASAVTSADGGFAAKHVAKGGYVYENLGGPWGITHAKGKFAEESAYAAAFAIDRDHDRY